MQKLHIIYIPGIGDHKNPKWQSRAVGSWKFLGVDSEFFQMNWNQGTWESKFKQLLKRVDEIQAEGRTVGLVAVSAGASAAINVYAARPDIVGVVLIAGKVNRPGNIGKKYHKETPAFIESIRACQKSLKKLDAGARTRIQSRYALADELVYKLDSRVPGAHNKIVLGVGHFLTIGSQIYIAAPFFIRFLKRQVKIK